MVVTSQVAAIVCLLVVGPLWWFVGMPATLETALLAHFLPEGPKFVVVGVV